MTDENKNRELTVGQGQKGSVSPARSLLPVMPLAALLPQQGEVMSLLKSKSTLENLLFALTEANTSLSEEQELAKASQESMLQQVVSWMQMGENK